MGWSIQEEDSDPAQTESIFTQDMRTQTHFTPWPHSRLGALFLALVLGTAGAMEAEDTWETGSGHLADEINVLEHLTLHATELVNISLTSEDSCLSLRLGQYSTLSISTRAAFGDSFADSLSVLIKLQTPLQEDTSLITILGLLGEILFQIRINPNALTFRSSRWGHYEFPVSSLTDGRWHRLALAISAKGVALYVDCKQVETLPWSNFFGLGVKTDGILMLGGLIEPYEVPFKGSLQQLVFVMGDPGAAKDYCHNYNQSCLSSFPAEQFLNLSRSEHGQRPTPNSRFAAGETQTMGQRQRNESAQSSVREGLQTNTTWRESEGHGVVTEQTLDPSLHKYLNEFDLSTLKEENFLPVPGQASRPRPSGKPAKKEDQYKKLDPTEENITTDKKVKTPVTTEQLTTDKYTGEIIDLTKNVTKSSPLPTPSTNMSSTPVSTLTTVLAQENQTDTMLKPTSSKESYPVGGSGDAERVTYDNKPISTKPKKTPIRGYPGPRGRPFPSTPQEWQTVASHFASRWDFPNCGGAIDGKHVRIVPPPNSGSYYYNYKGFNSVVMLAVVSATYEFMYVDVGMNGRISDGGAITHTEFYWRLQSGSLCLPPPEENAEGLPFVFVADEAFALTPHVMRPFPMRTLTPDQRVFNYRLSRARRVVENAFGILASRFRLFLTAFNLAEYKLNHIVLACCILHNFLKRHNRNYVVPVGPDVEGPPNAELTALRVARPGLPPLNARVVRDQYMQYFVGRGAIALPDDV